MAARRAALSPDDDYTPSDAEKEADAAALKSLGGKGGVEVSIDEDDDDDEEPEAAGPSRREKRQQRRTIINENAELREREARARETAAQALGYAQALQQRVQAPTGPQADPWEEERKALQAEQDLLVREFELKKASLTSDDAADFKRRAWAFEEKKAAYHARRTQPQLSTGPSSESILMARYPDIMGDERVKAWAYNRYNQRQIETNRNDWALRDEVVEEAREQFGMKPKRRDDREPAMRRKLTGMPKGGSGGGGEQPGRIQLTKDQVKEADVAYPHLPPEKRYKHFAKVITRSE
jgi:hypothetical protein